MTLGDTPASCTESRLSQQQNQPNYKITEKILHCPSLPSSCFHLAFGTFLSGLLSDSWELPRAGACPVHEQLLASLASYVRGRQIASWLQVEDRIWQKPKPRYALPPSCLHTRYPQLMYSPWPTQVSYNLAPCLDHPHLKALQMDIAELNKCLSNTNASSLPHMSGHTMAHQLVNSSVWRLLASSLTGFCRALLILWVWVCFSTPSSNRGSSIRPESPAQDGLSAVDGSSPNPGTSHCQLGELWQAVRDLS